MITIDHLVRRITVRSLPTRPHLWSANFGPRFTSWRSVSPHVRIYTWPFQITSMDIGAVP